MLALRRLFPDFWPISLRFTQPVRGSCRPRIVAGRVSPGRRIGRMRAGRFLAGNLRKPWQKWPEIRKALPSACFRPHPVRLRFQSRPRSQPAGPDCALAPAARGQRTRGPAPSAPAIRASPAHPRLAPLRALAPALVAANWAGLCPRASGPRSARAQRTRGPALARTRPPAPPTRPRPPALSRRSPRAAARRTPSGSAARRS